MLQISIQRCFSNSAGLVLLRPRVQLLQQQQNGASFGELLNHPSITPPVSRQSRNLEVESINTGDW